jgi:hypothetical protein
MLSINLNRTNESSQRMAELMRLFMVADDAGLPISGDALRTNAAYREALALVEVPK